MTTPNEFKITDLFHDSGIFYWSLSGGMGNFELYEVCGLSSKDFERIELSGETVTGPVVGRFDYVGKVISGKNFNGYFASCNKVLSAAMVSGKLAKESDIG